MATTAEVVARVSRLASGQSGLLTAAQAEREGVTRSQLNRLAEAGVLERVERGVYATTSSSDENRDLRAAWLALEPTRTAEERLADVVGGGVVSHTSAAGLHKLGDLRDDVPEVTYPSRKQTRRDIRVHRGDLTKSDITLVDGLPTTTRERTIVDLLRDGHDPEHVAQIIGQGIRRGDIDLAILAERLEPLARRYEQPDGESLVAHLLDLVGLSPAAIKRELAQTPAGKELVATGAEAFLSMFASAMQTIDWAPILAMNKSFSADLLAKLDVPRIAGMDKTLETAREALGSVMSPAFQDAIAQLSQTAARGVAKSVRSAAGPGTWPALPPSEQDRLSVAPGQAQSPTDDGQETP